MKTLGDQHKLTQFQDDWKQIRPEDITRAFECFSGSTGEYERVTGVSFGTVTEEFVNAIKGIDLKVPGQSLCLCFGIENEVIQMFFQVNGQGAYMPDKCLFETIISHRKDLTEPFYGVSVDYKNEVCTNWAMIPYYSMNNVFFQTLNIQDPTTRGANSREEFLVRPGRVQLFLVQESDLVVMQKLLQPGMGLAVHFGVNYGHSVRQQIAFTPVIEIRPSGSVDTALGDDDEDPTYLDFVDPCPPNCPD